MPETTALGAAMAAGAAEGVSVWSLNPDDLSEVTSEKFEPQINPEGIFEEVHSTVHRVIFFSSLRVSGRERVPVCPLEESRSEVYELGDHRAAV